MPVHLMQAFACSHERIERVKRDLLNTSVQPAQARMGAACKYMYAMIGVVMVLYCGFRMIRKRQPVFGYLAIWGFVSLLVFWAADPYLWVNPIQHLFASLKFNLDFANGPAVKYTAYPR